MLLIGRTIPIGILNLGVQDGRIAYLGTDVPAAARIIEASGLIVIPGVIDSHMHASSWLGGSSAFRMMAKAGVTTADGNGGAP